jgi:hypothetical protein
VLGPDDTYTKFANALEACKKHLADAQANLSSDDGELRQEAAETMRQLGELAKASVSEPDAAPALDVGTDHLSIGTLAALLPTMARDAANNADRNRQRMAQQALGELDAFASLIAKASKSDRVA